MAGQRNSEEIAAMNRLYYGDNLDILRNKIASDSVDLCSGSTTTRAAKTARRRKPSSIPGIGATKRWLDWNIS